MGAENVHRVVVDTWGWISLADVREPRHADVVRTLSRLWRRAGAVITTDYVLDETLTLVFKRLPTAKAKRFLSTIAAARKDESLTLEHVLSHRFDAAIELRLKFADKPAISFTDLTTMVVMREIGCSAIVSADAHFKQVGLGLRLLP
jgi:predicted nucleic acid-binding protein